MSLAETVLAATILALAAAAIVSLLPTTLLSVRRSAREMQAGALAQSLLEQQKLVYFNDIYDLDLTAVYLPDGLVFKPRRVVTGTASPNAKQVRIQVSWRERDHDYQIFRQMTLARILR